MGEAKQKKKLGLSPKETVAYQIIEEGEPTYSGIQEGDQPEEFLVTVYGGDREWSERIIAQTEVLGYVRGVVEKDDKGEEVSAGVIVIGPQDLAVHLVTEEEVMWINRMTVTAPKKVQWIRKEIDLPMPPVAVESVSGEPFDLLKLSDSVWEYGRVIDGTLHIRLVKGQAVTINFPEKLLEIR